MITRRRFLGSMVVLVCAPAPAVGGCGSASADAATTTIHGWTIPHGTKLSPARFASLAAAMDALVPGDAASPGATLAHAAYYLDRLLGAFDVDPPLIFAGGPYSGRHGGADGFDTFTPLTRVEELRWRTYLEGSQGIKEREWNGPVIGLRERYESALDTLEATAQEVYGASFAGLDVDSRRGLMGSADADLRTMIYGHAVEGTYGDPVYGGNFELAGWQAIDYEGDRQPLGYTAQQMAHPEKG